MTPRAFVLVLMLLAALARLGGCHSVPDAPAEMVIDAGDYERTFDAAREVLRESRFTLQRVDARAGLITTAPKRTAGLHTPWDGEQSSLGDEIDDLANAQQRVVWVRFEPRGAAAEVPPVPLGAAGPDPANRTEQSGQMVVRIEAAVERLHRPGLRVETESIRRSTYTRDPAKRERRLEPVFAEPLRRDTDLAKRLMQRVRERVGDDAPADPLGAVPEQTEQEPSATAN